MDGLRPGDLHFHGHDSLIEGQCLWRSPDEAETRRRELKGVAKIYLRRHAQTPRCRQKASCPFTEPDCHDIESQIHGGAKGWKQSTLLLLIADTESGFNDRRQESGTSMLLNLTRITFLHRSNNA